MNIRLNSKYTIDSILTFIAIGLVGLSAIIINISIDDNYDLSSLGVFNVSFSFYMIIIAMCTFGLNRGMVYFLSKDKLSKNRISELIINAFIFVLLFSIILSLFSFCFIQVLYYLEIIDDSKKTLFSILIFSIPIYSINNICIFSYNGLRKMKYYSMLRILRWLSLFLILHFVLSRYSFEYIYLGFLITELIVLIVNCIILSSLINIKRYSINFKLFFEYGRVVYPSQVLISVQENLDIILFSFLISDANLGIYSFSSRFAKSLSMIGLAFQINFNPIISQLINNNKFKQLKEYIKKIRFSSIFIFLGSSVMVSIVYFIVTKYMLSVDDYFSYYHFFIIQLLGGMISGMFAWSGGMLIMSGRLIENFHRIVIKICFSVIIFITCFYFFGFLGVYISFTLVMVNNIVIDHFLIKKYLGVSILK